MRQRLKAFTLVELMLVAGVALIVAGLSLPILAPLVVRDELAEATDGLVCALSSARAKAIRSGEIIYCAFIEDVSGSKVCAHRTLWGERGENYNPNWSGGAKVLRDLSLPPGMRFADSNRRSGDPCALPALGDLTPDGRYPVDRDSPPVVPHGSPTRFFFFRPDGSASSEVRIGILSGRGELRIVRVERATGELSVESEP